MNPETPASRFERVVARIFEVQGFAAEGAVRGVTAGRNYEIDLLVTWQAEVRTVVEVKTYRSRTPSPVDLVRAAERARRLRSEVGADHWVLATNLRRAQLPPTQGIQPDTEILCVEDLIWLANGRVDLINEVVELDRELSSALHDFEGGLDLRVAQDGAGLEMLRSPPGQTSVAPPAPTGRGSLIAAELRSTPTGRAAGVTLPSGRSGAAWRLFEQVCLEALQYVFHRQFEQWREQENAGGADQRFDVLAKVKGDDVFSRMLVEDFRTRFVLFEFKNYGSPVKPNPILVTEKYLNPRALRSTAVIISPNGLSLQAVEACRGALRDAGKLILDLDVATLCSMLEEEDVGTSPDARMERILDAFLQQVGR
jgi:Holliday junction resolvase-like predicted endonuclease